MKQLTPCNDLLDNHDALRHRWEEKGALFFRDVLDQRPLARLRDLCLDFLAESHLVVPGDRSAHYTGGDLKLLDLDRLNASGYWRDFVVDPAIAAFFRSMFNAEPTWLPVGECRISAPLTTPRQSPFDFIHADGVYTPGISFGTCWIPLVDIDEAVGGLALAEGMHQKVYHHDLDRFGATAGMRQEDIPAHSWRRADYRPGDLVIFDSRLPHSGLANNSDRFRISVDFRFQTNDSQRPAVGVLCALDDDYLVVTTASGDMCIHLDERTYCRNAVGNVIPRDEVAGNFHVGDSVIVGLDGQRATVLRHQK